MHYKIFLKKHWLTIIITLFIIVLYFIFFFILDSILGESIILTIIFIIILLIILFPVKDFLQKQQKQFMDWDYFHESEFHHFEFLSEFFTLDDLIYKVTPELMVWLKIEQARLMILTPDKKNFIMYFFEKGRFSNSHIIPKKRILNIIRILKKYHKVLRYDDVDFSEKKIMKKFNVFLVVPFFHLNRLMGFISFHQPTINPHVEKALELYAIKFAFLIHDEIIKRKIQNITKYEEEIRIAKKIQNMLQNFSPPIIPNFKFTISNLETSSLIEFFTWRNFYYIIILSTSNLSGVAGLLLSGKLGKLFVILQDLQDTKNNFKVSQLLDELKDNDDILNKNYFVEVLVLEISHSEPYITTYTNNASGYLMQTEKGKIFKILEANKINLEKNTHYSFIYKQKVILSIIYTGMRNEKVV